MHPFFRGPLRWFNLHPVWRKLPVPVWGSSLRAPTADRWLALQLHRWGLMGREERRFLAAHIQPGMTVLDIGANQGLYGLFFARLAGPAGQVVSFEPDDLLYSALRENVDHNEPGTVRTHHLALGSRAGDMILHRSLFNSGDNRLASEAEDTTRREAVNIRVERVDRVLAGQRVNFVKMDVQGWELEVLRGMSGLLDDPQNARLAIYFEFWPQGLRDAGSEPTEILDFLDARGFRVCQPTTTKPGLVKNRSALARLSGYTNLYAFRDANC